jgi:hypothetical protein
MGYVYVRQSDGSLRAVTTPSSSKSSSTGKSSSTKIGSTKTGSTNKSSSGSSSSNVIYGSQFTPEENAQFQQQYEAKRNVQAWNDLLKAKEVSESALNKSAGGGYKAADLMASTYPSSDVVAGLQTSVNPDYQNVINQIMGVQNTGNMLNTGLTYPKNQTNYFWMRHWGLTL